MEVAEKKIFGLALGILTIVFILSAGSVMVPMIGDSKADIEAVGENPLSHTTSYILTILTFLFLFSLVWYHIIKLPDGGR